MMGWCGRLVSRKEEKEDLSVGASARQTYSPFSRSAYNSSQARSRYAQSHSTNYRPWPRPWGSL